MSFRSILFPRSHESRAPDPSGEPEFFHDLNLDQVVGTVTAAFQEYDLVPFFYVPLRERDAIVHRQEVMRDLERDALMRAVKTFAERMRAMRARLAGAEKVCCLLVRERWLLEAVELYCGAVEGLEQDLGRLDPASRALRAFREWLSRYVGSSAFTALATDARKLTSDLSAIRYCILIDGNRVTVRPYEGQSDYSAAVEDTFQRFRQDAVKDYRVKFPQRQGVDHVTAQILEGVARLHPAAFSALGTFCAEHATFLDGTITRFDREVQF